MKNTLKILILFAFISNSLFAYEMKNVDIYLKKCDYGNPAACTIVGDFYSVGGEDFVKDMNKSIKFWTKACDLGETIACMRGGTFCAINRNLPNYEAKAKRFFKKYLDLNIGFCNWGNAKSCRDVGAFYSIGLGVEIDMEKAKIFFQKGCDNGDKDSCESL